MGINNRFSDAYSPQSATVVVVSSYVTHKPMAAPNVLFCDGIADDSQLNAAQLLLPINDSGSRAGTIYCMGPRFNLAAPLSITASPVTFQGDGGGTLAVSTGNGTVLYLSNGANCNMIQNADTTNRVLFLEKITLAGNHANNTGSCGINADYLDIGGHYLNGLPNVMITDFISHGIVATTHCPCLSANSFTILANYGDGIHTTTAQGWQLGMPNWINVNVGWGLYVASGDTDSSLDIYVEGNQKGGAYLGVSNSVIKLWSKSNYWQGLELNGGHGNKVIAHLSHNCQSAGGVGYYAGEIVINGAGQNEVDLEISDAEQLVAAINGIYFKGSCGANHITGKVRETGYAIYNDSAPALSDTSIDASLYGALGLCNDSVANLEGRGAKIHWQGETYATQGVQLITVTGNLPIGLSGVYGGTKTGRSLSGRVGRFNVRLVLGGTFSGDTITVKYSVVYNSGNTGYIEKTYTATGTYWLTDEDIYTMLSTYKDTYEDVRWVTLNAKTNQVSTSVTGSATMVCSGG